MTFSIPVWTIWVAVGILWVACGVLNYGFRFAFFQREFPSIAEETVRDCRAVALLTSVLGPVCLIIGLFIERGHGIMFVPDWKKERPASMDSFLRPRKGKR